MAEGETEKLFETESVMNRDVFAEMKNHLIPYAQRVMTLVFILLFAGLAVVGVLLPSYPLAIAMPIVIVAIVIEYPLLLRKQVTISVSRLRELVGTEECVNTTCFDDTGFMLYNHATGGKATLAYADLQRLVETANFYVLFTKTNQYGLINKRQIMRSGQCDALMAHLRRHCPKMRLPK